MKRLMIIQILSSMALISCSTDINDVLFRDSSDPFKDIPEVKSFEREMTNYVSWKEDECCDEYILMRREDSAVSVFKSIYQGTGTEYVDTDLTESSRYIYRLDKVRGNRRFSGEKHAYGVGSTTRNDAFEDNDSEARAILLETDYAEATMPCYKIARENIIVSDVDWYYVTVPPKRQAEVIIKQTSLNDGATTNFYVLTPNNKPAAVKNNFAIELKNTSHQTQRIAFKVYANESNIFTESSSGTVFLQYKIFLDKITLIQ